jgi:hypothetical protein
MLCAMTGQRDRKWLGFGVAGFLLGLLLLTVSQKGGTLGHLALVVMIAAPVIAFWRAMKPSLARHCPRPPEPGSPI